MDALITDHYAAALAACLANREFGTVQRFHVHSSTVGGF